MTKSKQKMLCRDTNGVYHCLTNTGSNLQAFKI